MSYINEEFCASLKLFKDLLSNFQNKQIGIKMQYIFNIKSLFEGGSLFFKN